MTHKQSAILSPHATSECIAELINIIDTSTTSRRLMQRMDRFLHETITHLKGEGAYAHFLLSLRDALHKHDIPSEKLKTIHYHLVAIELSEKMKQLNVFHEEAVLNTVKESLLEHHCITTYDQVWLLNKLIFYINAEPFTHEATLEALKAIEAFKVNLKECGTECASNHFLGTNTQTFIDKWALIYDELITIFRLR